MAGKRCNPKQILMRPLLILFAAAAAALMLAGCIVQSLNPYYTKESISEIPGIEGEWNLLGDNGKPQPVKPWLFGKEKILAYDERGTQGMLKAVYFRAGESFFLDTTAEEPSKETNEWWVMHVFPVHLVTRVEIHEDKLTLTPIDYSWLEKAMKSGDVNLPHIMQKEENSLIFTASAEEWMGFLKKYANDKDVFPASKAMNFVRYKGSAEKVK